MKRFTLRAEHVTLLRSAVVSWDDCEYGAPAIDCKRPYGNSSGIELDIALLLGWELFEDSHGDRHLTREQEEDAHRLHQETMTALAVVLAAGSFEPGPYVADDYRRNWRQAHAGEAG